MIDAAEQVSRPADRVLDGSTCSVPAPFAPAPFSLRPVTTEDTTFLRELYRTTRARELALLTWDDRQKAAFCDMQYTMQTLGYRHTHPQAEHFIVCSSRNEPAGRLIKARVANALQVVDISLVPAFRGRGWGGAILRGLQAEAARAGASVHLSVDRSNPAISLYQRAGFEVVDEDELRFVLHWQPVGAATQAVTGGFSPAFGSDLHDRLRMDA